MGKDVANVSITAPRDTDLLQTKEVPISPRTHGEIMHVSEKTIKELRWDPDVDDAMMARSESLFTHTSSVRSDYRDSMIAHKASVMGPDLNDMLKSFMPELQNMSPDGERLSIALDEPILHMNDCGATPATSPFVSDGNFFYDDMVNI